MLSKVRQNNDFPRSDDTEGRRESSDALRLGRLSESAKDCRLAKMAAAESAGRGLSIAAREPVATIESKMAIANTTLSGRGIRGIRSVRHDGGETTSDAATPVAQSQGSRDRVDLSVAHRSTSPRVKKGWPRVRIERPMNSLSPPSPARVAAAVPDD